VTREKAKPKNARPVIPSVCRFCRSYAVHPGGWWMCEREGCDFVHRDFGADGLAPCKRTCDRFESIYAEDDLEHVS
jgi:hypothetical protein